MMKFLKTSLIAIAITLGSPSLWAAASSEPHEIQSISVQNLKNFAQVGKQILKDHSEDLKNLWTHGAVEPSFIGKIRELTHSPSKEVLDLLHTTYNNEFTTGSLAVSAIFAHSHGQAYACNLTQEERAFAPLGLAATYLTLENPSSYFRHPLFNEGFKALFEYFTDSRKVTIISFATEEPQDVSPPKEASDLTLEERMSHIKKICALQYTLLMHTPLTESLRYWDVAKTSGWWAFLENGSHTYQSQEKVLFHNPMQDRFKKMISDAASLKTQIAYDTLSSFNGTSYKDLGSNEEKFEHFFMEELGNYVNAALQKYFFVKGKEEVKYDQAIENVRSIKTFTYKIITDLVVRLYPGLSAQQYDEKVSNIVARAKDLALKEMKALFNDAGIPTKNWLWGELIFEYKKAKEYNLVPTPEELTNPE